VSVYKGHHKRDEFGDVLSRAEETRNHRRVHPGQRKKWDAVLRNSEAGEASHKKYNDSEKGRCNAADGHLRRKYGKTLTEKQEQYDKQNGICTLCGKSLPADISACHWDHNHVTGHMRDLLHMRCNLLVGLAEDDLCDKAIAYVARHSNVQS